MSDTPSLPVEQVKPMTDTTDTELEDRMAELEDAIVAERECPRGVPSFLTERTDKARAALRSYVSERTLDTRRLDWLEARYAEGEGFSVTVFEQMSLGARGVIDQRMASKKESPDDR